MRSFLKWLGRILLILVVVAGGLYLWKREEITRLLAVNTLFSQEKIIHNFSNMDELFLTAPVPRGDTDISPLPPGQTTTLSPETRAWIDERDVTALVILNQGAVVHESYYHGTTPDDRRISWSVAKSFLSALTGILLEDGTIDSIDAPVTQYAPELIGSAYDGATLKYILQMSSGVTFDEGYQDFNSDINKMGRTLALGGSMDDFAAALSDNFAPAGQQWQYVSIDTHIIGMVIRGATGRSITDLLSEKIIVPMGLEAEPYYVTDGEGVAFVLGGLNLTTRDYARFGQMIAQGGEWQGQRIVPEGWIDASTTPSANTAPGATRYGYQWWIPQGYSDGEFFARGIYGQYIYINRTKNIVIAVNSADIGFNTDAISAQNRQMLQQIAEGL